MAIEFDAVSYGRSAYGGSASFAHSITTDGSGHFLFVHITTVTAGSLGTPTYDGETLTQLGGDQTFVDGGNPERQGLFYMVNPALGSNTVYSATGGELIVTALSITGVDPNDPLGDDDRIASNSASSLTRDISSEAGQKVWDFISVKNINATYTQGALQTKRAEIQSLETANSNRHRDCASEEDGDTTVTMSWSGWSARACGMIAVALKPEIVGLERAVKYFHNVWDPQQKILDNAGRDVPIEQIQGGEYIRTLGVLLPTARVYTDLIENPEVGYIEAIKKDEIQGTARIKSGKESLLETFLSRIAGRGV